MQVTTIGLDLAKHWFQVHGVDANGRSSSVVNRDAAKCSRSFNRWHRAWSA